MLEPLAPSEWDRSKAMHLATRAGFGGSSREIDAMLDAGLAASVDSLVQFPSAPSDDPPSWTSEPGDFTAMRQQLRNLDQDERRQAIRQRQQTNRRQLLELADWWLNRMRYSPYPLQEKLTLFLHGHFATSARKVRNAGAMWRQNETFRELAGGEWRTLVKAMAKDPAMLIYLDGATSKKQKPNENFARELMELFTLGEGEYSEHDIQESARAFTGYSLARDRQSFQFREIWHDGGTKEFFGKRGNFDGDAIIEIILEQPQASRFIASKLWRFFTGAETIDPGVVNLLGESFRRSGGVIALWLGHVFRSKLFYHPDLIASQIKGPIQWYISATKLLERNLVPMRYAQRMLDDLGQVPFMPPNVKGWDQGTAWITVSSLLARFDYGKKLVEGGEMPLPRGGRDRQRPMRGDQGLQGIPTLHFLSGMQGMDADILCDALESQLLVVPLKPERRREVVALLSSGLSPDQCQRAVAAIVASPEFQLT